jgi:hypothetical protein
MKSKSVIYWMVATILFSCSQKENFESNEELINETINVSKEVQMIELGPVLQNPYSVENMLKAYQSLKSSNTNDDEDIKTTHYYVRFLPKDYQELDFLEEDTSLILFDYPLDRKIMKGGSYYHDPQIPADQVTWQYTVVPVDYTFNKVKYEIIAELYLKDGKQKKLKSSKYNSICYEEIEKLSLKLTGNYTEDSDQSLKSTFFPSGTIMVYDHVIQGYIGLYGAKVRMVDWFTVREVSTNYSGNFSTNTSFANVDYSIKWETNDYDIRSGTWAQAYTTTVDANESTSPWILNISAGNLHFGFATVHRAAFRFHYEYIGGMRRPGTLGKLKFCVYDSDGTGSNWGNWDFTGIFPDVNIWLKKGTSWRSSNTIFSTTIHEIGHSTHISTLYTHEVKFLFVDIIIRESWANAVEWYITQLEYFSRGKTNYDVPDSPIGEDHMQTWNKNSDKDYTPLFIDLVDDYNQSLSRNYGNKCPYGGTFDGKYCYLGNVPSGETPFIYNGNLYYTPVGCCDCPVIGAGYDGANCFIMGIPANVVGRLFNSSIYLSAVGNSSYPYDEIVGYSLPFIESNMLNGMFDLNSLESKLKANKPTGITDKHIDLFLDLFYNL